MYRTRCVVHVCRVLGKKREREREGGWGRERERERDDDASSLLFHVHRDHNETITTISDATSSYCIKVWCSVSLITD